VSGDDARRLRDRDYWIERGDGRGLLEWIAYEATSLDEAQDAARRLLSDDGDDQ
jgi:hypothetical protein